VIAFDYGYDSGEEWNEDDVNGEDVDEGDEEEGETVDDADSDLDSWLVDDDEVVELESERREPSPSLLLPILPPTAKRKLGTTEKESTLEKKRRAVVPLVPFAKGPVWEQSIGNCHSDAFTPYKIHLFNGILPSVLLFECSPCLKTDTPYPIDPYTFVSDVQERLPSKRPPNDQSRRDFVVPALPGHLTVPGGVPLPVPNVDASVSKRVQSEPKTAFPEAQLSVLITKMTSLATGNTNFLVESVYQELREHKIKKNAILAKIKEVGQKCKEKKIWVVKDDIAVNCASQTLIPLLMHTIPVGCTRTFALSPGVISRGFLLF
jgi:chromatin assembly factor 1 subunit A